ncbi:MAG: hypothetical protein ACK56W_07150 [Pirellula sp.]|jgi:hypothetical protein
MRTEFSISYCNSEKVIRCYRSARLREIRNYCGAVDPTIEMSVNEFIEKGSQIIEDSLQFCETNWADVPNAQMANSEAFSKLRSTCVVINFSRASTKKGEGVNVFAWGIDEEERSVLREPLNPKEVDAMVRGFIETKFGLNNGYSSCPR